MGDWEVALEEGRETGTPISGERAVQCRNSICKGPEVELWLQPLSKLQEAHKAEQGEYRSGLDKGSHVVGSWT